MWWMAKSPDRRLSKISALQFLDEASERALVLGPDGRLLFLNTALAAGWPHGRLLIGRLIWDELPDIATSPGTAQVRAAVADRQPRRTRYFSNRTGTRYEIHIIPTGEFCLVIIRPEREDSA